MKKIAIYGKGGIGKSTVSSNLSAAFSLLGQKVLQVGCDPKADSTIHLVHGKAFTPALNLIRDQETELRIDDLVHPGFHGVMCMETGGPTPGVGCAGRGIIATFKLMEELEVLETLTPDVVLYDVLGDVVCGGFAAPIREGYAEDVYIVTSGEKMSLFAAENISKAVKNFEDRGYARVRGVIFNSRGLDGETEKVQAFADSVGVPVIGRLPRSQEIMDYEDRSLTVVEGDPTLPISLEFFRIAKQIIGEQKNDIL